MFDQNHSDRATPTLLVIDPSAADRARISHTLAQLADIRVISTDDGEHALGLLRKTWPSMILLDTALSGIDGIALTRMIRELEKSRGAAGVPPWTPIIFLSSVADDELLAECMLAGGDDFLCKPVSDAILLAKARAMLRVAIRQQDVCHVHQQLKEIAILDALTGIPNRRYFDDTLAVEWKRCQRTETPLSIVIADIDFFRQFNDIYGNLAGDTCLRAIAGVLTESLFRIEDTVARYGGEEFIAILPGTDAEGAHAVAERMRQSARDLAIPHERGIEGRISCSFGVASTLPHPGHAMQHLLRTADAALFNAKNGGRNRVTLSYA